MSDGQQFPPTRLSEKIKVFTQSLFRIEWIIIVGLLVIIGFMVLVIYKMGKQPGELTNTVVGKLLDQLNILEGGLIAWGTQIISAMTSKIRSSDEK